MNVNVIYQRSPLRIEIYVITFCSELKLYKLLIDLSFNFYFTPLIYAKNLDIIFNLFIKNSSVLYQYDQV